MLSIRVLAGKIFQRGERVSTDKLNAAALPTAMLEGQLEGAQIADKTVVLSKLSDEFAMYKAAKGAGRNNHIWIAARPDGINGNGTVMNPFDVTGDKYDALIRELYATGEPWVIRMYPGVYQTVGYLGTDASPVMLGTGMKLCGSGPGMSIVKLTRAQTGTIRVISAAEGITTDTAVEDLTIDANAAELASAICTNGVVLCGDNATIRNVELKGLANKSAVAAEMWGAAIVSLPGERLNNCRIERVRFKGTVGFTPGLTRQLTFCSIAHNNTSNDDIGVWNGTIQDCTLELENASAEIYGNAFDISNARHCVIDRNFAQGATIMGTHQDSRPCDGLAITRNQYVGVGHGIFMINADRPDQHWKNITIEGNTLLVKPTLNAAEWPKCGVLIWNNGTWNENTIKHIAVRGNIIGFSEATPEGAQNTGILISHSPTVSTNVDYVSVVDNQIDIPGKEILLDVEHSECHGNHDSSLAPVAAWDRYRSEYRDAWQASQVEVSGTVSAAVVGAEDFHGGGMYIPSAAAVAVDAGGTVAIPRTAEWLVITGSGAAVNITRIAGAVPGVIYRLTNARTGGTPGLTITADATWIYGTTRTLAAAGSGVVLVVGMADGKVQIL